MFKHILRDHLIFIVGFVAACGQHDAAPSAASTAPNGTEKAPTSGPSDWSLMVANVTSLPPCDAGGEGRLAYVKAQSNFMSCTSGSWQVVDIRGGVIQSVASGKDGAASLIAVADEAPGGNCQFGGKKIDTGIDADNNGNLSSAEIKSTQYMCKESPGMKIKNIWSYHDSNIDFTTDPDISLSSMVLTTKVGDIQLTRFEDGSAFFSVSGIIRSSDSRLDTYVETFSESFFVPNKSGTFTVTRKIMPASYLLKHRLNLETDPPQISLGVEYNNQVFYRDFVLSPVP